MSEQPALVYMAEENGPANMLQLIRYAKEMNKPIPTGLVRHMARMTDSFFAKLEAGRLDLKWGQHLQEEKEAGRC